MARDDRVEVVLHPDAIAELVHSDAVRRSLAAHAGWIVRAARATAPRDTGAGAASIHAETVLDGPEWVAKIGWDQTHFYMKFHEVGTVHLPARPFLAPALDRYAPTS